MAGRLPPWAWPLVVALATKGMDLYALPGNAGGSFWQSTLSAGAWAARTAAPANVVCEGALVYVP